MKKRNRPESDWLDEDDAFEASFAPNLEIEPLKKKTKAVQVGLSKGSTSLNRRDDLNRICGLASVSSTASRDSSGSRNDLVAMQANRSKNTMFSMEAKRASSKATGRTLYPALTLERKVGKFPPPSIGKAVYPSALPRAPREGHQSKPTFPKCITNESAPATKPSPARALLARIDKANETSNSQHRVKTERSLPSQPSIVRAPPRRPKEGSSESCAFTVDSSSDEEDSLKVLILQAKKVFIGNYDLGRCAVHFPSPKERNIILKTNAARCSTGADISIKILEVESFTLSGNKPRVVISLKVKADKPLHKRFSQNCGPHGPTVHIMLDPTAIGFKPVDEQIRERMDGVSEIGITDAVTEEIERLVVDSGEASSSPRRSSRHRFPASQDNSKIILQYPKDKSAVDPVILPFCISVNRTFSERNGTLNQPELLMPAVRRQVLLTMGDLERLAPFEFLNDNLVDFYLKYMLRERKVVPPRGHGSLVEATAANETAAEVLGVEDEVHVFTAHFYKKLTGKVSTLGASAAAARAGTSDSDSESEAPRRSRGARRRGSAVGDAGHHASVARWSKDFDIFAKRFVFVPIVEHLHWSLAVVCNLDCMEEHCQRMEEEKMDQSITADEVQRSDDEIICAGSEYDMAFVDGGESSPMESLRDVTTAGSADLFVYDGSSTVCEGKGSSGDEGYDGSGCCSGSGDDSLGGEVSKSGVGGSNGEGSRAHGIGDGSVGGGDGTRVESFRVDECIFGSGEGVVNKDCGEGGGKGSGNDEGDKGSGREDSCGDGGSEGGRGDGYDESGAKLKVSESACSKLVGASQKTPARRQASVVSERGPPRRPCIVFMDSLNMHNSTVVATNLRSYLWHEWRARKSEFHGANLEPRFSKYVHELFEGGELKVVRPRVPKQDNCCDCGVFALQYAEEILLRRPVIGDDDVDSNFIKGFTHDMFNPNDIKAKRVELELLIRQLAEV